MHSCIMSLYLGIMESDETLPAFWIDVGGTFTDCIARWPDGSIRVHKLLSTGVYKGRAGPGSAASTLRDPGRGDDPPGFFAGFTLRMRGETRTVVRFDASAGDLGLDAPFDPPPQTGEVYELFSGEEAPITGIRRLLGLALSDPVGPVSVRLGTTRGTNALLEHTGARCALAVTRGFADVLRIANQDRPRLFDLQVQKPVPLYEETVEIAERIASSGEVLLPLDEDAARRDLEAVRSRGVASLAVCLLNGYANPAHEKAVGRIARELGFEQVSVSTDLAALPKIVSRGDTAVVDAYLSPVIRDYVSSIRRGAPEARIRLMTSAGALADAEAFCGKDSIFSGPAGGVVGCAKTAQTAGFEKVVGFDMGGTSTDVSRFDGEFERRFEMEVKDPDEGVGVKVMAPMLAIETVAAGGGSVCRFDGQKPVVGPASAGADPGPACYGRGGPLTLTDCNLLTGRLLPDNFSIPLDAGAARRALEAVRGEIEQETGAAYEPGTLAEGFLRIADAGMAAPIKKISIARGIDVRDHVLVSFGGAGGQHAASVARLLGVTRVLVPPLDGVLSAFGIGAADVRRFGARHVGRTLDPGALEALAPLLASMDRDLVADVAREGIPAGRIDPPRHALDLRYRGQEVPLTVEEPRDGRWREAFEREHRRCFGFAFSGREVEVIAARSEVTGRCTPAERKAAPLSPRTPAPDKVVRLFHEDRAREAPVFLRDRLAPGDAFEGPALVLASIGTVVVPPGFRAEVTGHGDLLLTDAARAATAPLVSSEADPITLEIFNNHFASIAEQMGALLQKTALSTNVKERLDFSCALFDPHGELVANAPHIPVHLGAMSECVKALMEDVPDMHPGDVFVTNDPYRGGSHLPDVTVVTPVFSEDAGKPPALLFFTASRAHHAEIGGVVPGSMPPGSRTLSDEGVVIRHFRLVEGGVSREDALRRLLAEGPHPSRAPAENIADINAQVAADNLGARQLLGMVERYGRDAVQAYMGHIRRAARNKLRRALLAFEEGERRFADALDDGSPLAVRVAIRRGTFDGKPGGEAVVDFTGTGPVLEGNLNANPAIVSSAVLYVFRTLIGEDIPLNGGMLEPLRIVLPPSFLHPPRAEDPGRSPAVAGGNVETSQRIVDALLGALDVVAASQGTMNNLTFGNERFGYYETLGGGAGAGDGFPGADAVHVHMTNTRLTDAEILEARYPVRLRRFAIRRGSGGKGAFRGGDGLVREIEFLEPVAFSLITQRRTRAPWGKAGGGDGAPGRNLFLPREGGAEALPPICGRRASAGDALRIETPGGGAWGAGEEKAR